eukprot:2188518-Rhodomonas_salina.1
MHCNLAVKHCITITRSLSTRRDGLLRLFVPLQHTSKTPLVAPRQIWVNFRKKQQSWAPVNRSPGPATSTPPFRKPLTEKVAHSPLLLAIQRCATAAKLQSLPAQYTHDHACQAISRS